VQLIVVSPMRRAIQTCLISLDWLIDSGVPILPDARWQGAFQFSFFIPNSPSLSPSPSPTP
jgi:hypothetical protein